MFRNDLWLILHLFTLSLTLHHHPSDECVFNHKLNRDWKFDYYRKNNQTHVFIHSTHSWYVSWRWSRWGLNSFRFDFFFVLPLFAFMARYDSILVFVTCNNLVKTFWHIKYSPRVCLECLHHHHHHLAHKKYIYTEITTSIATTTSERGKCLFVTLIESTWMLFIASHQTTRNPEGFEKLLEDLMRLISVDWVNVTIISGEESWRLWWISHSFTTFKRT